MDRTSPELDGQPGRHRELPSGLSDLLPETADHFLGFRQRLLGVLGRWGYRPVVTPLLEYGEVFSRAQVDPSQEASLYKLVDRATGHVLGLRSDFTPQVARLAGTRFRDASLPLRLCYEGSVVRHVPARTGRARELRQVGAELLGVSDPEADAEAIALAIACLREIGLEDFKIDVGQVEFFRGILLGTELPGEDLAQVTAAMARKDVSSLEQLLAGLAVSGAKRRLLAELPLLAGGVEVLDRAGDLVESDHSRADLENLVQVVRYVEAHGLADALTIDLGELRGIDYHSGVIFEAFVPHLGRPLCRGGRYDGLLDRYGIGLPATGFSLDLGTVMEAVRRGGEDSPRGSGSGAFIINFLPQRSRALGLARCLRAEGVRATRDLICRPLEESIAHARGQAFNWAVVLGRPGNAEAEAILIHLATGREETLPLDRVQERLSAEEQRACRT